MNFLVDYQTREKCTAKLKTSPNITIDRNAWDSLYELQESNRQKQVPNHYREVEQTESRRKSVIYNRPQKCGNNGCQFSVSLFWFVDVTACSKAHKTNLLIIIFVFVDVLAWPLIIWKRYRTSKTGIFMVIYVLHIMQYTLYILLPYRLFKPRHSGTQRQTFKTLFFISIKRSFTKSTKERTYTSNSVDHENFE